MQEMGLQSIRTHAKQNYKRLTFEKRTDRLKLQFTAKAPNEVWVSDVTYFKMKKKFYYTCVIIDLYSGKVIAYKISAKHSSQLISSTFKSAYSTRNPQDGLTFHSDRGSQYTSSSFQKLLLTLSVKQSFSPSAKPCHNAVMESFFASMKKEELYRYNYLSVDDFKKRVGRYIDFYNNERPHATINYKTPNRYEELFYSPKDNKKH